VQGIVRRIDLVATADLPRISAQHGAAFSPNQALRFGAAALGWMRQQAAARPGQHLRFCYEGSAPRGSSAGGGSGGGGAIRCEVLEGGALPQRLPACKSADCCPDLLHIKAPVPPTITLIAGSKSGESVAPCH
jgi:hypothetical protein